MVTSTLKMLWQEEDGQDLVEYSLLLAFIALAAVTVLSSAGTSIKTLFNTMSTQLNTANTTASS
jgi:pilus assembly protein Flp/PilA